MKTLGNKWPLGLVIKNLFKGQTINRDSEQMQESELDRPTHEQRTEAFEREIQIEIKRAESMELRRLGMLAFGFLVFATTHQTLFKQVIAIGKEVTVS